MPDSSHVTPAPLLIDVKAVARMLGVSTWTIRYLAECGELSPVELPSTSVRPNAGRMRRLLFHIDDVRAFADRAREGHPMSDIKRG